MQKVKIMRIGHGYDIHQFTENAELILGGIKIPYEYGVKAHSDGDVLIHAVCDAILGALALGDIGQYFPDTDPKNKNIDSRKMLNEIVQLMQKENYNLGNLDATIITEKPKLSPHINAMCKNLSKDLQTDVTNINIKATTHEKQDAIGQGKAIAAHAVVLLMK